MVELPAYATVGIVDIELGDDDCHNMFVERLDEKALLLESSRAIEDGKEYTIRFTLPIVDWVFEIRGEVKEIEYEKDIYHADYHYLLATITSMDEDDRKKLDEFITLHKAGKIVIRDIM